MRIFWYVFIVILLGAIVRGIADQILVWIGLKWQDSSGAPKWN